MNGPLVTNSKLNLKSLKSFKDKLSSNAITNEDVLELILELESCINRLNIIDVNKEKTSNILHQITQIAWEDDNDFINAQRIRDLCGEVEYVITDESINTHTMQNLLVRVLQHIKERGVVTKDDDVILDLERYINEARLYTSIR